MGDGVYRIEQLRDQVVAALRVSAVPVTAGALALKLHLPLWVCWLGWRRRSWVGWCTLRRGRVTAWRMRHRHDEEPAPDCAQAPLDG